MREYGIFGGCLETDVEFPDLPPPLPNGSRRWLLRTRSVAPPADALSLLGEDHVAGSTRVRLYARPGGYRLTFDDTGSFDLSAGGAELDWYPGPLATLDACRLDVIGRVLATALFATGTLCLHGSAVTVGRQAVAFLGPKGHGKSTLAGAMVQAGHRLLTDDALPVDPGPPPTVGPGLAALRLWSDSAHQLGASATIPAAGKKHVVAPVSPDPHAPTALPLAAIYLLTPVTRGAAAERTRLPPVVGALAIVRHAKLGPLLGGATAPTALERAAALARLVPVYALAVVRDYSRMGEAAARVGSWHAPLEPDPSEPVPVSRA